jgi:outer membrane receptor protein involved in Fe transport
VGIPQNTASLSATWYPRSNWRTYAQVNYIGPLSYYQSSNQNVIQGANAVVNASVSFKWDQQTNVFVNVINAFNRQYQDGTYTASSPQTQTLSPPRMISLGLKHLF